MLEQLDFDYDSGATGRSLTTPRQLLTMVVGCGLFVIVGVLLLLYDSQPGAKIAAVAAIVFFGGGATLALALTALQRRLPRLLGTIARLHIDANGITVTSGSTALAAFRLGPRMQVIPWSNIAGFRIVDIRDTALVRRSEERRAALPYANAVPPVASLRFVCIVPKDLEAVLVSKTGPKATLNRLMYAQVGGAIPAGPLLGLTPERQLELFESYREEALSRASPST